jgi:hypothetical protein
MESLSKIAVVCFRDGVSTGEQYYYCFDERAFVTIANLYRIYTPFSFGLNREIHSCILPRVARTGFPLARMRRSTSFIKRERSRRRFNRRERKEKSALSASRSSREPAITSAIFQVPNDSPTIAYRRFRPRTRKRLGEILRGSCGGHSLAAPRRRRRSLEELLSRAHSSVAGASADTEKRPIRSRRCLIQKTVRLFRLAPALQLLIARRSSRTNFRRSRAPSHRAGTAIDRD